MQFEFVRGYVWISGRMLARPAKGPTFDSRHQEKQSEGEKFHVKGRVPELAQARSDAIPV